MNDEILEEPQAEEESATEPVQESVVEDAGPSQPRLVLKRSGQETDIEFPFASPAVVGRFDPAVGPIDIDLGNIPEGSYVSRRHAKIVEADGAYSVIDLNSSNGTYVLRDDFEKVDEAEISDGTEIAFGNARFVFKLS